MDNSEKLETHGTQDEEKQNKNTICTGYHYVQKNTTNVRGSRGCYLALCMQY
jgi:hypothetical protein